MASLDDIVAATKILAQDSEYPMGGSGSKAEENRVGSSDVKQDDDDDDDGSAGAGAKGVVLTETAVESTSQSNCGFDKEKSGVGNLSRAGESVGSDETINDGKVYCVDDGVNESEKLKGSGRNSLDAGVAGDGNGRWNGGNLEDGDHGFRVGDFVWGKIKSHPWWPGQVYDPRDASEFAVKHSQEGRILVAFFGDGSCSWCLPSQLVPFVENFKEMSRGSSSKSFLNAIQRAVDEVGRLVECRLTCKCIPLDKRHHLARPVVANAGVRAGILVPEVDIHRLSIPQYQPGEILAEVMNYAKAVSVEDMFQLAVLRSWISAFYFPKCGYQLPVYTEPLYVEGLEDNDDDETPVTNDFSVPIEVPIQGPQEDDWMSSPAFNSAKSQASSEDKIYHKRKQKSVAELMGKNNNDKPKSQKRAPLKEGKDDGKAAASSLKRQKNVDGRVKGGGSQSGSSTGKSGRKRRVEVSKSSNIANEKVVNVENSGIGVVERLNGGSLVGKPKEIEVTAAGNTSIEAKEELEKVSTPRERKKSKYLSPPYTNLSWRMGNLGSKPEWESDKNMTKVSGDLCTSAPASELDHEAFDEKLLSHKQKELDASVKTNARAAENDKKLTFPVSEVNVPVNELLSEIQFAALDPFYLSKKGSLDMVWAFISALRSSTYLHGADYRVYQKCKRVGRKRKSLPSRLGNQEKEKAESPGLQSPKALKIEAKPDTSRSKKAAEFSHARSNAEKLEGKGSSILILTFTPGFPLPAKEEIMMLYGKFGSLNEKETNVLTDSHSVQIVFMKDSDAEAAFKSSVSLSPFGIENVNYWLQHSPSGTKPHGFRPKISSPPKRAAEGPGSSQPTGDLMSDVRVIRQKLEIMTAILENYHSKFLPEDKSSLRDEMKHLMDNVETASEKVRVMAENHLERS